MSDSKIQHQATTDPKNKSLSFPFLDLPPELWNKVYGFCFPISSGVSEFVGLTLTCKQVATEYESKVVRIMTRFLNGVKQDWLLNNSDDFVMYMPTHLSEMKDLTIILPRSSYLPPLDTTMELVRFSEQCTKIDKSLHSLFALNLPISLISGRNDILHPLAQQTITIVPACG
ncbi:hypothetical protein P154DRAFT_540043 [Amniculicola lignicola CBS 123094]|uniref:Uncharacterized protein n=1 Tax=Amniculicola lignicola CBS 123094 TaxID=1392246 RepID=A0A6A5VYY2_9PLEO|nr:hypothetical protein P154DRAFT_540043 [Amniculicola lignicola CBS 123094]